MNIFEILQDKNEVKVFKPRESEGSEVASGNDDIVFGTVKNLTSIFVKEVKFVGDRFLAVISIKHPETKADLDTLTFSECPLKLRVDGKALKADTFADMPGDDMVKLSNALKALLENSIVSVSRTGRFLHSRVPNFITTKAGKTTPSMKSTTGFADRHNDRVSAV